MRNRSSRSGTRTSTRERSRGSRERVGQSAERRLRYRTRPSDQRKPHRPLFCEVLGERARTASLSVVYGIGQLQTPTKCEVHDRIGATREKTLSQVGVGLGYRDALRVQPFGSRFCRVRRERRYDGGPGDAGSIIQPTTLFPLRHHVRQIRGDVRHPRARPIVRAVSPRRCTIGCRSVAHDGDPKDPRNR